MDKFSLSVGYRRVATAIWEGDSLTQNEREWLQAYSDGVNDYIKGIGLYDGSARTAFLRPLEFYALGIKDIEPWHPIDVLSHIKFINFHLSHDWATELLRDIIGNIEGGALKYFAEEIVPFGLKFSHNFTTILSEEEMKQEGLASEKTLWERYQEGIKGYKTKPFPRGSSNVSTEGEDSRVTDNAQFIDDQKASNNWVIHGNHTATG